MRAKEGGKEKTGETCFASFLSPSHGPYLHFQGHFQLEISSKCGIKAENSSTLCKFHEGRKGLRSMGSNPDRYILGFPARLCAKNEASERGGMQQRSSFVPD